MMPHLLAVLHFTGRRECKDRNSALEIAIYSIPPENPELYFIQTIVEFPATKRQSGKLKRRMESKELDVEDSMCPICMCILVEPVTMPCTHTLCYPCFKQNVEDTSLTCPMCRTRISNWARRASKNKTLINRKLWQDIQRLFPERIRKRLDGTDDDDVEETVFQPIINIAQPGEIRQEYEEQMKRLQKQREKERMKELEASELLIKKLQEEEDQKAKEQRERELKDLELAVELSKQTSADIKKSRSGTRCSSTSSLNSTSTSRSGSTIESFINKMREAERLKEEDRVGIKSPSSTSPYPYKCYTPTEKGKKTLTEITRPPFSRSDSTIDWQRTPSITIESESDTKFLTDLDTILPKSASADLIPNACDFDEPPVEISDTERCESTESVDSIGNELRHFKPIRSCPLTPPRKLPSGKVIEPPLIRTTPRNLTKNGLGSPICSLSDIDASSPIMQRRLSELEEERKQNVNKFSKSTSTGINASHKVCIKEHNYSGREEKTGVEHNYSANVIDLDDEPSGNKGSCVPVAQMPVLCAVQNISENKPRCSVMPELPKMVIPLEPNLDDINDFDIAPLVEINNISNIRSEAELNVGRKRKRVQTNSTSDTSLLAEKHSPSVKKKRNLSGKCLKKDTTMMSPQRSIKDWIVDSKHCQISGDQGNLFRETIQVTDSCRDDVDGNLDSIEKQSSRTQKTLDYLHPGNTSRQNSSDKNSLTEKSYPLRKRKNNSLCHTDYIWEEWSPKKKKKKALKKQCQDSLSDSDGGSCNNSDTDETDDVRGSKLESDSLSRLRLKNYQIILNQKMQNKGQKLSKVRKNVSKNDSKFKSLKHPKTSKQSVLRVGIQSVASTRKQSNQVEERSLFSESVSDKMTEKEKQELKDRELAEKLAKQFEFEAKLKMDIYRSKGSIDEYNFRHKSKVSAS